MAGPLNVNRQARTATTALIFIGVSTCFHEDMNKFNYGQPPFFTFLIDVRLEHPNSGFQEGSHANPPDLSLSRILLRRVSVVNASRYTALIRGAAPGQSVLTINSCPASENQDASGGGSLIGAR